MKRARRRPEWRSGPAGYSSMFSNMARAPADRAARARAPDRTWDRHPHAGPDGRHRTQSSRGHHETARPTARAAATPCRPGAEGLEPRIVLSAQIGVSLDFNTWYAYNPIWTDLHNLASTWTPAGVALTADGYPLANASTQFAVINYPAGNYQFSYTGGGTVSFSGDGQLVGPVTVSGGVTSGTVAVSGNSLGTPWVNMQVTNVNTSNPMDNFHLMMPGYGNGTTSEPMFTPAFIQALEPFSDIRFMNWEADQLLHPVQLAGSRPARRLPHRRERRRPV